MIFSIKWCFFGITILFVQLILCQVQARENKFPIRPCYDGNSYLSTIENSALKRKVTVNELLDWLRYKHNKMEKIYEGDVDKNYYVWKYGAQGELDCVNKIYNHYTDTIWWYQIDYEHDDYENGWVILRNNKVVFRIVYTFVAE